jgi:hypothetical protein
MEISRLFWQAVKSLDKQGLRGNLVCGHAEGFSIWRLPSASAFFASGMSKDYSYSLNKTRTFCLLPPAAGSDLARQSCYYVVCRTYPQEARCLCCVTIGDRLHRFQR